MKTGGQHRMEIRNQSGLHRRGGVLIGLRGE